MFGQASAMRRTRPALIGGPPASGKSCRTQGTGPSSSPTSRQ